MTRAVIEIDPYFFIYVGEEEMFSLHNQQEGLLVFAGVTIICQVYLHPVGSPSIVVFTSRVHQ